MAPPVGHLRKDRVLVKEERDANTLYNKGYFGNPQSGGALELELAEALHLAEAHRLRVFEGDTPLPPGELFVRAARLEPGFEVRYVVYRDLRSRGLVVRASNVTDFNVYPAKGVPGKSASTHLVRALSERSEFDAAAVAREAARSAELGKRLLIGVVDEEGDLTHYAADVVDPDGDTPPLAGTLAGAAPATLLADGVVVTDPDQARALTQMGHFGRDVGPGVHLSFPETLYLMEEAGLGVRSVEDGERLTADTFRSRARGLHPDFDLRYDAFRDLKARGMVVKTGFKFGTHYRAYRGDPNATHAPLLVHALPADARVPWPEIAGFVRLAHGVRKDVLFAVGGQYVRLRRTKP